MTSQGTLILVVGRSGAGKDTLLRGVVEHFSGDQRLLLARRVITRAADDGSEAHEPVTAAEFLQRERVGDFLHTWQAHNLCYALPIALRADLESGRSVLANVSRTVINDMARIWPTSIVVEITAPLADVKRRLNRRGRETGEQVKARLERHVERPETSLPWHEINNNGTRAQSIEQFVSIVEPLLRSLP